MPISVPSSIDTIQREVASYFEVKLKELRGLKRNTWYTVPRMVAMYLVRKLTRASYNMIGRWFGGRDHGTVIHAVQKVERLYAKDGPTRRAIVMIESHLTALEPA